MPIIYKIQTLIKSVVVDENINLNNYLLLNAALICLVYFDIM